MVKRVFTNTNVINKVIYNKQNNKKVKIYCELN